MGILHVGWTKCLFITCLHMHYFGAKHVQTMNWSMIFPFYNLILYFPQYLSGWMPVLLKLIISSLGTSGVLTSNHLVTIEHRKSKSNYIYVFKRHIHCATASCTVFHSNGKLREYMHLFSYTLENSLKMFYYWYESLSLLRRKA